MLILGSNNKRYLVVSDLHIGFESSFTTKGVKLDNSYILEMSNDIISVFHRQECTDLILLGDVKDSIDRLSKSEWLNIPLFFNELLKHINANNIHIIKGNHDSKIDRLLPMQIKYSGKSMLIIEDTLLLHGHTQPRLRLDRLKSIVMGHVHPVLLKEDSVIHGERVWVIMRVRVDSSNKSIDIIIMPALNRYITSSKDRSKRAVPLFRRLLSDNIIKAVILTLDGSIVGDENLLDYVISD